MILSLVTDLLYARGWEHSCVIVLADDDGVDNMCMGAVANLSIVRSRDIRDQSKSVKSDSDTSSDSDEDVDEFNSDEDDDFQSNNDQNIGKCCTLM